MRRPRIEATGEGFYHVASRIAGRRFLLDAQGGRLDISPIQSSHSPPLRDFARGRELIFSGEEAVAAKAGADVARAAIREPHAFQVVFDLPYAETDVFGWDRPVAVSARTFLSQLP
jgi:hypothetical protein